MICTLPAPTPPVEGAKAVYFDGRHTGWLMPQVRNHVPEQPTNRYKRQLIERQRQAAAETARNNAEGRADAGPIQVSPQAEASS